MGINYVDTADLYRPRGLNEEFVGKAIKQKRQDIILATKVGNRFEKGKEGWSWDPSKTYIKAAVKDIAKALAETDYIDLYPLFMAVQLRTISMRQLKHLSQNRKALMHFSMESPLSVRM